MLLVKRELAQRPLEDWKRVTHTNRPIPGINPELERLADILLSDHLKNRAPNKMQTVEYPYLSETQFKRRLEQEAIEFVDDPSYRKESAS